MHVLTHLVLSSLCVFVHSAVLGPMIRRHTGYGVYANEHPRPYRQVVYAAIPLHGPMKVLHVLTARPLSYERTYESSVEHPIYVRAPYRDNDYAPSAHNEYEYTAPAYDERPAYLESYHYGSHQFAAPTASASDDDVKIIYARPNPRGGFTYRRRPSKAGPKRTPAVSTEAPVVIRVHRKKRANKRQQELLVERLHNNLEVARGNQADPSTMEF
ncbi:unnamed protein product [Arctia plantaginis]|uniref:Uncharacterized protein n=1 Tax=Arctia plantaginis TaxID=874455 RepID=A0A8S0Z710_ARCPL|nr:unnamed protein product [Arctia plantaginis]